jgi:hypothetical protein
MESYFLKKPFALIIIAIIFSATVNAQIVYYDINPDTTITTGVPDGFYTYHLDLNNDGTLDFDISAVRAHNWATGALSLYALVTPLDNNEVLDSLAVGVYYPVPLGLNSNVGVDSVWNHTSNQILRRENAGVYNSGYWSYNSDAFLGLKLINGSDTYYGWILLSIQESSSGSSDSISITIKGYAYNSIPYQSIRAGDTSLVSAGLIEKESSSSFILYPNPAINNLTISLRNYDKPVSVSLTDISGKLIYRRTTDESGTYQDKMIEVNTKDFDDGIYEVQVLSGVFIETKKLIIKK